MSFQPCLPGGRESPRTYTGVSTRGFFVQFIPRNEGPRSTQNDNRCKGDCSSDTQFEFGAWVLKFGSWGFKFDIMDTH